MSEELKAVSYCVGMSIADSLLQQELEGLSTEVLAEAISDIFSGKTAKYSPNEANEIIQNYLNSVGEKKFAAIKEEGEAFLAENKNKAGITTTASGLQFEVVEEGKGEKPAATNTVKVHYHGTLIDGTVFDSSISRGEPATFGVHYIPQELAYGAHPHPGGAIKPFMALIFDVELLDILA